MERVTTSRAVMGICHMQVCAIADATDTEILAHCNRHNPAGTRAGWTRVIRAQDDPHACGPGPCDDHAGRLHFLVEC